MKYKNITLVVAGAIASMAMTGFSFGATAGQPDQTASPSPDAATAQTNPGAASDEVIITARKKRHKQHFRSSQSIKTMDQDQIRAAGAVGGVSRAMSLVPGVSVSSYGNTGSQKTSFSINGIKTGWGNFTVALDNGSLGVTFDGVPMVVQNESCYRDASQGHDRRISDRSGYHQPNPNRR